MDVVGEYAERFGVYQDMPELISYSLGRRRDDALQHGRGLRDVRQRRLAGRADAGRPGAGPLRRDHLPPRPARLHRAATARASGGGASRSCARTPSGSWTRSPPTRSPRCCRARSAAAPAAPTVGSLGLNLAGKTGTTNEAKDVWFIGYSPRIAAGCFMGYDTPRPLGDSAFGGTLCAPIFAEFMKVAMAGQGPVEWPRPAGRPLHQDRPLDRPAPARQRHRRQRAVRVHQGRPAAWWSAATARRSTAAGGWAPTCRSSRASARRRSSGCRCAARPGCCRRTPRWARCRAAGSTRPPEAGPGPPRRGDMALPRYWHPRCPGLTPGPDG